MKLVAIFLFFTLSIKCFGQVYIGGTGNIGFTLLDISKKESSQLNSGFSDGGYGYGAYLSIGISENTLISANFMKGEVFISSGNKDSSRPLFNTYTRVNYELNSSSVLTSSLPVWSYEFYLIGAGFRLIDWTGRDMLFKVMAGKMNAARKSYMVVANGAPIEIAEASGDGLGMLLGFDYIYTFKRGSGFHFFIGADIMYGRPNVDYGVAEEITNYFTYGGRVGVGYTLMKKS